MSYWRNAGFSYLRYANVAAKALRSVLKADAKAAAAKREDIQLKQAVWKDGKPGEPKFFTKKE